MTSEFDAQLFGFPDDPVRTRLRPIYSLFEAQRLVIVGQGLGELVLQDADCATAVINRGQPVGGSVGQGLVEVGHGIVERAGPFADQGTGDAGGGVPGVNLQSAVEAGQVTRLLPQHATIVQDPDGCCTGRTSQRVVKIFSCVGHFTQSLKGPAAVGESVYGIGRRAKA